MEKEKILKSMILTFVFLAIIAGIVWYAIATSPANKIVGVWEGTASDGTKIELNFSKDIENVSTQEKMYYLTVTSKDGAKEEEKGVYNVSNNTMLTLRPSDETLNDNAKAFFYIEEDKIRFEYTVNFETYEFTLNKVK